MPRSISGARAKNRFMSREQASPAAMMERLEPRQLLAADLGVSFDTGNFQRPSIAVPGDFIRPDTGFQTPIRVVNLGPQAAVGLLNISFFLSTDTTLNTSNDLLLREYRNEQVQLPVFNGDPNDIGDFSPDMRIPAETAPGRYFIIVRLSYPNSQIGDFNSSNNIAVSDQQIRVERRFGNVDGRQNVTAVLSDAEGTLIAFSMPGGGSGEVTFDTLGRFIVTTTGTGATTDLNITTSGGDGRFDLAALNIGGSIRNVSAPAARLVGTLSPGVSIASATFGDVVGPVVIAIPATSVAPRFTFANVSNLSITSLVGLMGVTVTSWNDTDTSPDSIVAPYLDDLRVGGDLDINIRLSGGAAPGQSRTLRSVAITGLISGTWSVNGGGGNVNALATRANFAATFRQRLDSFNLSGTLRGTLSALQFGTVNIGRDMLATRLLAGAYLGSDARLGGTGNDADEFRAGRIDSLVVARNVFNTIVGAGLQSIAGSGIDAPLRLLGGTSAQIRTLTVGGTAGAAARFLANRYVGPITIRGNTIDTRTDARFQLVTLPPVPAVTGITVSSGGAIINVSFDSSGIMNLASITGATIRIEGPGGFSQNATLVSKRFVLGSLQRQVQAVFQINAPNTSWSPADNGEYSVLIVANTAADGRGNFALPGTISQFLVNV